MTNHCQQLLTRLNNYRQQAKKFKEVMGSFKEPADLRQAMEEYQQASDELVDYSESLIDIPDTKEKIALVDYLVLDRMIRMLPDEDKRRINANSLSDLVNSNHILLQKGRVVTFYIAELAKKTDTPETIKQRTAALNQAGCLTQLKNLYLSNNSLTQIDISRLTQLEALYLFNNPLLQKEKKRLVKWAKEKGAALFF